MLGFLTNLGTSEMILIVLVAVLIFGKDLPQAASKVYLQMRKLRGQFDDLRRDTGIDQELRRIERTVREAEWEARRPAPPAPPAPPGVPRAEPSALPSPPATEPRTEPPPELTGESAPPAAPA